MNMTSTYSHNNVRQKIKSIQFSDLADAGPTGITGPTGSTGSTGCTGPTGCTGCNDPEFTNIQTVVDNCCSTDGSSSNSLCRAIIAGDILQTQPISCMIDLIDRYMNCGQEISQDKKVAAFEAFSDITGYEPIDVNTSLNTLRNDFDKVISYTIFYTYVPIGFLLFLGIWLSVIAGWINWVIALILTIVLVMVLYIFSILFRSQINTILNNDFNALNTSATNAQKSFQDSIALLPQALFGVACAVTCESGEKCWLCNEVSCPTCDAHHVSAVCPKLQ